MMHSNLIAGSNCIEPTVAMLMHRPVEGFGSLPTCQSSSYPVSTLQSELTANYSKRSISFDGLNVPVAAPAFTSETYPERDKGDGVDGSDASSLRERILHTPISLPLHIPTHSQNIRLSIDPLEKADSVDCLHAYEGSSSAALINHRQNPAESTHRSPPERLKRITHHDAYGANKNGTCSSVGISTRTCNTSVFSKMSIKTFEGAAGQEGALRTSTLVHPHELLSIKKIGEGAFGVVERCLYKTEGRTVAVKKLNPMTAEKKKDRIESLKTEIAVLKRLHHKNIIQYIGHGNVDTNTPETADKTQFLVLELLEGGSLKKLVGRQMAAPRGTQLYSDKQAVKLLLGVAQGLQYLHSRRPMVIHRDLKLENVMLDGSSPDDFCPKIVDFGCAALVGKPTKSRFAQDVAAGLQSNRVMPVSRSGSDSSSHPDVIETPRQSREYTPVESWNDNYVEGFYCPPGPSSPLAHCPPGPSSPLAHCPPGPSSPLAHCPPGPSSPLAHFQSQNWENAADVIMAGSQKALQDTFVKKDVGPTIQHFVQGGGLQLHARTDSPTQGTFMKPVPNPKLITNNDTGAPNLSEKSVACLEQAWTEHARTRRVPIKVTSKTKAAAGLALLPSDSSSKTNYAVGLVHLPSDSSIPVEVEMDLSNLRISKPEDHLSGRTGTLLYMAPEVYLKRPYDDKADVFSFGAIAYELLHRYDMESAIGRTLQECEAYARRVATGRFRPPIDDTMAPPLVDFIRSCWEGDPKRRPSMDQIVNKLEDFLVTMDGWQHPLGNRSSSEEPEDRQQDPALSRATAICGCCIS